MIVEPYQTLHIEFTLGPESQTVPSFIRIRFNSSESLQSHDPPICEEIQSGLRRLLNRPLPVKKHHEGWISIDLLHTTQLIISRVICRLLLVKEFPGESGRLFLRSHTLVYGSGLVSLVFHSLIAWLLPIERTRTAISGVLREDILQCLDRSPQSPQNFTLLQELVETSRAEDRESSESIDKIIKATTVRVLSITFSAIDPTTVALSQVVLDLLGSPQLSISMH